MHVGPDQRKQRFPKAASAEFRIYFGPDGVQASRSLVGRDSTNDERKSTNGLKRALYIPMGCTEYTTETTKWIQDLKELRIDFESKKAAHWNASFL